MRAKQTILISKNIAKSREEAKRIASAYADRIYTIRETDNFYRLRQLPPYKFVKGSFKTYKVKTGIYIVYGELKSKR